MEACSFTQIFVSLTQNAHGSPRTCIEARVAALGVGPIEFGSVVHLNIEEGPSVEEGRSVIVLVPFYVMWNPDIVEA